MSSISLPSDVVVEVGVGSDLPQHSYRATDVLVLGASGFIGRWVARALTTQQANLVLPVRSRPQAEQIFLKHDIAGEVVEIDLLEENKLEEIISSSRPTIIFNLAGYGVDQTERDSHLAYATNATLVNRIARAMAKTKNNAWPRQAIIHVGSALEYGNTGGKLCESSIPQPTSVYGKSKLAGARLLARRCRQYQMNGMTVRLFSVYGDGEHDSRLLPLLIQSAKSKEPIRLTSGMQRRDFTYVADVAEGLLRLGLCSKTTRGEVVNLATGQLTSVKTFTETAAAFLRIPPEHLRFGELPTRAEEMEHSDVSIERLWQLTNWRPNTDIHSGISDVLSSFPN